jgi:hypothetical protein
MWAPKVAQGGGPPQGSLRAPRPGGHPLFVGRIMRTTSEPDPAMHATHGIVAPEIMASLPIVRQDLWLQPAPPS